MISVRGTKLCSCILKMEHSLTYFQGNRDADVERGHGDRGLDEERSGDTYTLGEGNGKHSSVLA